MKSLIALTVIAAATLSADQPELAAGTAFDAADELADQLISQGLAKLADEPKTSKRPEKVRVLADCDYGRVNDVVTLTASVIKSAQASGLVDSDKDAVAYALTLDQNKSAV
jgi:hypothetical protein